MTLTVPVRAATDGLGPRRRPRTRGEGRRRDNPSTVEPRGPGQARPSPRRRPRGRASVRRTRPLRSEMWRRPQPCRGGIRRTTGAASEFWAAPLERPRPNAPGCVRDDWPCTQGPAPWGRSSCSIRLCYGSIVVEKVAKLSPETVIVIGPNTSVIGGAHFGWKTAVSVSWNCAFPFCTGKSPPAPTDCLLSASGTRPCGRPRSVHDSCVRAASAGPATPRHRAGFRIEIVRSWDALEPIRVRWS